MKAKTAAPDAVVVATGRAKPSDRVRKYVAGASPTSPITVTTLNATPYGSTRSSSTMTSDGSGK